MAEKDPLYRRIRDGILFDCYGTSLTEKQRMACEMILVQDLSLAEAAEALGVSRQGVHDLLSRAREHMENYERDFGVAGRRRQIAELARTIEDNRERIPQDIYAELKKILEKGAEK